MYTQIAVILASTLFLAWWTRRIAQESAQALLNSLSDLDENLATIVQRLLENLPGAPGGSGENPLMSMIAQVFQKRMEMDEGVLEIIPKDESGKFRKLEEFE